MRICPDAAEVREIVHHGFLELGISEITLRDVNETVRIDDGRLCARSYRIADLMAMWLIDIGIIQYYDAEGNMLRRTNLLMESEPRRVSEPRRIAA
ncbi:MAG: hypothetical protein GY768_32310 [Planctomycetaceae bacterium]|nr:hypothetical protein [Planctomycetaceae bacterium]